MTSIRVLRGADRFRTSEPGRETRHVFSFGAHYDPERTGFGVLVACNEDRLEPGAGYDMHEHRGIEIVTWLLDGVLHHDDTSGHRGAVAPGCVQVLSAGHGVQHSELAGPQAPAHFVQMWLATDAPAEPPAYAVADVSSALVEGGWVVVAGGKRGEGPAVPIRQPGACLQAARLAPGAALPLPPAASSFVHVTRGEIEMTGAGQLSAGDSVLVNGMESGMDSGSSTGVDTNRESPQVGALGGAAEVLVWQLHGRGR